MKIKLNHRSLAAVALGAGVVVGGLSMSGCTQGQVSCGSANGDFSVLLKYKSGDKDKGLCKGLDDSVHLVIAQTYYGNKDGQPSLDKMSVALRSTIVSNAVGDYLTDKAWLEGHLAEIDAIKDDEDAGDGDVEAYANLYGRLESSGDGVPGGADKWDSYLEDEIEAIEKYFDENKWGTGNSWGVTETPAPDADDKCRINAFDEQASVPAIPEIPSRVGVLDEDGETVASWTGKVDAFEIKKLEWTKWVIDVSAANQGTTFIAEFEIEGELDGEKCKATFDAFGLFPNKSCGVPVLDDEGEQKVDKDGNLRFDADPELCYIGYHSVNPVTTVTCNKSTGYWCLPASAVGGGGSDDDDDL